LSKPVLALLSILLITAAAYTLDAPHYFDGKSWWEHVKVLADDKMEGRETGSEGLRKAEAYVVDQLKSLGLEPRGVDGFYQPVKLISRQIVETGSSLALVRDGQVQPLTLGDDAYFNTRVNLSRDEIKAPLVFVGYGLKIPERNYDDLQGLDLKGKVAVLLSGSPADVPAALASHYQTTAERWKFLREGGAIGLVSIQNPAAIDVPWSRVSLNRTHPNMELVGDEFQDTAGEKLAVTFNPAQADQLFTGSGHSFAELAALAKDRAPLPHFRLAVSIQARAQVQTQNVESANVVAAYRGSDPKLRNQYVVLSAHLDHLGFGAPIDGDNLYNGAMDNASGSALLLDVAHSLVQSQEKPRRSILFVFVTGEEKGLLGSKYFTAHPSIDAKSMVADINVDMFLPIVPLKQLTVYGLAESGLGDRVTEVAQSYGIVVQPDPAPLRNIFIRSDQYNFVRHGIPALMMDVGTVRGTPEDQIKLEWLHHRYHAPSDDLQQPIDVGAAALYEDIIRGLVISVANDSERPRWKSDSFFRRFAQPGE
jgi:Zn-dependent M28 family amino/carboxypeptidase